MFSLINKSVVLYYHCLKTILGYNLVILFSVSVAVIMVGLKPSDVPPPLGVKVLSAGTAACIADLVTFPLDTAKVRLQVHTHTQFSALH